VAVKLENPIWYIGWNVCSLNRVGYPSMMQWKLLYEFCNPHVKSTSYFWFLVWQLKCSSNKHIHIQVLQTYMKHFCSILILRAISLLCRKCLKQEGFTPVPGDILCTLKIVYIGSGSGSHKAIFHGRYDLCVPWSVIEFYIHKNYMYSITTHFFFNSCTINNV
jgi:hypothetical protein